MPTNFPFQKFLPVSNKSDTLPASTNEIISHLPYEKKIKQAPLGQSTFSSEEIQEINIAIHTSLKAKVTPEKYNAYFDNNFHLETITISLITFSVTTDFLRQIIEKQFLQIIETSVEDILGKKFKILINPKLISSSLDPSDKQEDFESDSLNQPASNGALNGFSPKNARFTLTPNKEDIRLGAESSYLNHMNKNKTTQVQIDATKTFDNFIIGPSNNMAFATAKAVSQNPGKKGNYHTLYIHSDSGLGKTHLLHAIANEIRNTHPSYVCCLTTAREFMKEMIHHVQHKKIDVFQKKYTEKIDILMIDDIHELQGKQGTQDEFFHIFNELHHKGKQLIFTSDKPPKEIDGIADRIKTRLQWGLVIDIQRPDYETRIAILKRKAQELDLFLHDDILSLIASSIKTSIRELEGSLLKLFAVNEVMKIEIDIEMVKDILKLNSSSETEIVTLESIARSTAQYFKISQADLKSHSRKAETVRARHIAMYLSQKIAKITLKEIGQFYGGRDHTSVIHAIERMRSSLATDSKLSHDIVSIENFS